MPMHKNEGVSVSRYLVFYGTALDFWRPHSCDRFKTIALWIYLVAKGMLLVCPRPCRVLVCVNTAGGSRLNHSTSSATAIRQSHEPHQKKQYPLWATKRCITFFWRPSHTANINPARRNNALVTTVNGEALPRHHLGYRDIRLSMAKW